MPPVSVRPLRLSECGNPVLEAPLGRIRRPGAGRKRIVDQNPAVRRPSAAAAGGTKIMP